MHDRCPMICSSWPPVRHVWQTCGLPAPRSRDTTKMRYHRHLRHGIGKPSSKHSDLNPKCWGGEGGTFCPNDVWDESV